MNVWKGIKEEEEEIFERRKRTFGEGVEAQNLKAKEKFLFILILTIRIHSEVFEVSIRKRTMDEVVVFMWSKNGCQ